MRLRAKRTHLVTGVPDAPIDGVHGPHARREGVLLELVDDRGRTGWGEASPLPGLSMETLADSRAVLDALDARAITLDDDDTLDAVACAVAAIPSRLPSARFALETALLDLVARARDISIATLLGAAPDARRAVCTLLAGRSPDALAESAVRAVRAGATTLKLKLDGCARLAESVARVRAVRAVAPAHIAIRLDANGTFHPSTVAAALDALAFAAPELVEEPVAGRALLALALTRPSVPVAADESLATADVALRSALLGAVSVIVLKPTLLGGVLSCLALAGVARTHGVLAIVTHTLDGPIALAAAAALALALPPGLAHGLAPHPALAAYPHADVGAWQGLELATPASPGLGLRGPFGEAA